MKKIVVILNIFEFPSIFILGWCDYFEPMGISSVINLFFKGQMELLTSCIFLKVFVN